MMSAPPAGMSVVWFLFLFALLVPSAYFYKTYLRINYGAAFGLIVVATVIGYTATRERMDVLRSVEKWRGTDFPEAVVPLVCFLFYILTVALLVRLFRAWVFGELRDGEELAGGDGARAWLSGGNLVCAIGIPVTGWWGFDYSAFALAIVVVLAIVARPMLAAGMPAAAAPTAGGGGEDASIENDKERVLRMLEEGSIQADEAADLLSALGATSSTRTLCSRSVLALVIHGTIVLKPGGVGVNSNPKRVPRPPRIRDNQTGNQIIQRLP